MISRFSLLAIAVFLFAGCGRLPQNNDPKAMREWKARYGDNEKSSQVLNTMPRDDLGRVVELRAIPQRVVVIGPGAVEMVFALKQESKLVGRDSGSDFPIAAKNVAIVGDFNGPNIERVVALNPDFVVVQGETYGRERMDSWQKQIGAPLASVGATTLKGVAQDMQKIASWLGAKNSAENIAPFGGFDASFKGGKNRKPQTAIVEIQRAPLMVAGANTLVDDVLQSSGFANATKVSGYKQLNLESLLANQPDFYIVPSDKLKNASDIKTRLVAERNRVLDSLKKTPGLKDLTCIKNGKIIVVPADWVLRPGPRLRDGIIEMTQQHLHLDK